MSDEDLLATQEDIADYSVLDAGNPRSLINIVPPAVKDAILLVPRKLLLMDEGELKKVARPNETLNYLRLNFWLEYNRAQEKRKPMNMKVVCRGVSSHEYLYGVILQDVVKTAWMVCPPADYAVQQASILNDGLQRLREALKVKLYTVTEKIRGYDDEGRAIKETTKRPNVAAMKEIREITMWLSDRVQGAIIQKVAIRSQSQQSLQIGGTNAPQLFDPTALDDLQKTIEGVNKRLDTAMLISADPEHPDAEIIDVE